MTFEEPELFAEALAKIGEREVVGSRLRSSEWRDKVAVALRERAFFSATVENARVLQTMKDYLEDFMAKAVDAETGGLRAQGRAEFVADMRELAIREGLGKVDPKTGKISPEIDEGDLTDLRSMARLQLIFDTQVESANEYGYWSQGQDEDVLAAYPAQRFIRVRPVRAPRPYHSVAEGAVRLKSDLDFWLGLNRDFGVPWGPWGFNSGMGVEDVDRIDAEHLGLIKPGVRPTPAKKDLNERLSASVRDLDGSMLRELQGVFGDKVTMREGRVVWRGTVAGPAVPAQKGVAEILTSVLTAQDVDKAHAALELPTELRGTLAMGTVEPSIALRANVAKRFLERMVHKDFLACDAVNVAEDVTTGRGRYFSDSKTAEIIKSGANAVHEFCHHIEFENPAISKACKAFRKSRTVGEQPQLLSVLTGDSDYGPEEKAFKDKWAELGGSHYMGKYYGDDAPATEILTMGMERLFLDPIGFAQQDPEYFSFIIQTLQKL